MRNELTAIEELAKTLLDDIEYRGRTPEPEQIKKLLENIVGFSKARQEKFNLSYQDLHDIRYGAIDRYTRLPSQLYLGNQEIDAEGKRIVAFIESAVGLLNYYQCLNRIVSFEINTDPSYQSDWEL